MRRLTVLALAALACGEGTPREPEALSLLGDSLYPPAMMSARNDSLLAAAEAAYGRAPNNLDSVIWIGRRLAYVGRYREAIGAYTRGLEMHPDEPRLLRHRGHRWITVRRLGNAVQDLERAAALVEGQPDRVEEDGLPNAAGIPVSTLHTNIWYHLGLAQYLRGAYAEARTAWERGLAVSPNPDMTVAFQYWLALTAKRTGDSAGVARILASVDADAALLENENYRRLLLYFRGDAPAHGLLPAEVTSLDDVTIAYGVAAWRMFDGNAGGAVPIFERILRASDQWPAFGYIAAEAELAQARMTHAGPDAP